jgi:CubicO group peptidase (beta-lactamase class C family)
MPTSYRRRLADLPEQINAWLHLADVPGLSIAAIDAGEIIMTGGFGVANTQTREPVGADTVFQAASLSKPVVAYAALRLADAGLLELDRPLGSYLGEPYATGDARIAAVTARQALSHSSGLQNWRFQAGDELQFAFEPGSGFQYSGEGYFYLQRALEALSGESFEALLRRLVFEPLGMPRSTYLWTAEHAAWISSGHRDRGEPAVAWSAWQGQRMLEIAAQQGRPLASWRYSDVLQALPAIHSELAALPNNLIPNAAGSLLTTAPEFARFLLRVIGRQRDAHALAPATHADMLSPQVQINQALSWGLGWGLEEQDGEQIIWHWGDNMIFQAFALAHPARQRAVVILTNSSRGLKVCERIVNHLTGRAHAAFLWL